MQGIQDIVEKLMDLIENDSLRKPLGLVSTIGILLLSWCYRYCGVIWMYVIVVFFLVTLVCTFFAFYYEEAVFFFRVCCWIFVSSTIYGVYKYNLSEERLRALQRCISMENAIAGFEELERENLHEQSMLPMQKERLDLYRFALLVKNGAYARARRLYNEKHRNLCGWYFHYQWMCIHLEDFEDALAVEEQVEKAVDYGTEAGARYCDAIRLNRGFVLINLQRYEEAQDIFAILCQSEYVRRDKHMLATVYNNWIQASLHIKDGRKISMDELEERLDRYREDCGLGQLNIENRNQWIQFKNDELNIYRQLAVGRRMYDENVNVFLRDVAALSLPVKEKCNFLTSTARIIRTMGLPNDDCRKEIMASQNEFRRLPVLDHYMDFRELMAFYDDLAIQTCLTDGEKAWRDEIRDFLKNDAVRELETYRMGLPQNAVNAWILALQEQILVALNTNDVCVDDLIKRYGEVLEKMKENAWGNRIQCSCRLDLVRVLLQEENLSCFGEVCYSEEILEQLRILEEMVSKTPEAIYAEVYLRMSFAYAILCCFEEAFRYDLLFRATEVSLDFYAKEYHAKYIFSLVAIRAFFIRMAILKILENSENYDLPQYAMEVLQATEEHYDIFLLMIGRLYGVDELCIVRAMWPCAEDSNKVCHSHAWVVLPLFTVEVDVMYPDMGEGEGDSRVVFLRGNHPVAIGQSAFVKKEIGAAGLDGSTVQPHVEEKFFSYLAASQEQKAWIDLLTGYIMELLPKDLIDTEQMREYASVLEDIVYH